MGRRIIIAGGGTGGHIFPAIAIANAIKKQDEGADILFVGAKGKMEMERVPQAGYPIKGLDIAGFNRSSLIKNIALPFKLIKSFTQVSEIFKAFRPEAVIGVGGYSTYPVLRYAQAKAIPTFIHESNSFAGKANILLGRKATRIFVSGEGMEKFFPQEKLVITGNPIRTQIAGSAITKSEGARYFKLDPVRTTILVTGGSLGAKSINEAVAESIGEFSRNDLQLIWQTGAPFSTRAKEVSEGRRNVWTDDFIARMEFAFAAADIVISRSGAMSIAELAVAGKPSIFVPYPFAAEDHQTVNAKRLVDRQAGLMVSDQEAREKLIPMMVELAGNRTKQEELHRNILALAIKNADDLIAAEILKNIA